jgi:hypothetical protein
MDDDNRYDDFLEINKILRSLTPISFQKDISIIGPKKINYRRKDGGGKYEIKIWKTFYNGKLRIADNRWVLRDFIKIKKKIPTKLQNQINKYIKKD